MKNPLVAVLVYLMILSAGALLALLLTFQIEPWVFLILGHVLLTMFVFLAGVFVVVLGGQLFVQGGRRIYLGLLWGACGMIIICAGFYLGLHATL